MLLPSAEMVPVKSIVTPPKASVSDTLLPPTEPLTLSLEKLGRMHARMTIILVDCTWDDSLRLAFTTSVLVELPELPEELEANPNTQGLEAGEPDTGVAGPLPPPPVQLRMRIGNDSKAIPRSTRERSAFPKSTLGLGTVTLPTSLADRRFANLGGNRKVYTTSFTSLVKDLFL